MCRAIPSKLLNWILFQVEEVMQVLTKDEDKIIFYYLDMIELVELAATNPPSSIASLLCECEAIFIMSNSLKDREKFNEWDEFTLKNFLITKCCLEVKIVEIIVKIFFLIRPVILKNLGKEENDIRKELESIPEYTKYLDGNI